VEGRGSVPKKAQRVTEAGFARFARRYRPLRDVPGATAQRRPAIGHGLDLLPHDPGQRPPGSRVW